MGWNPNEGDPTILPQSPFPPVSRNIGNIFQNGIIMIYTIPMQPYSTHPSPRIMEFGISGICLTSSFPLVLWEECHQNDFRSRAVQLFTIYYVTIPPSSVLDRYWSDRQYRTEGEWAKSITFTELRPGEQQNWFPMKRGKATPLLCRLNCCQPLRTPLASGWDCVPTQVTI